MRRANLTLIAVLWLAAGVLWTLAVALSMRAVDGDGEADRTSPPPDRFITKGGVPKDVSLEIRHRFPPPGVPYWPLRAAAPCPADSPGGAFTHVVAPGETLTAIVRGYLGPAAGFEPSAEANGLVEPYRLQVGRRIVIAGTSLHRTDARAALYATVETRAEAERRRILGKPANLPPESAFTPAEPRIIVEHAWRHAFAWWVPAGGAVIYLAMAAIAFFRTAARGRGRAPVWLASNAAAGGGAFALAGGAVACLSIGGLAAGLIAAAAAGAGACFGSRGGHDDETTKRYALVLFALLAVCALALWATGALFRASEAVSLP